MNMRRFILIFALIGALSLGLAALGHGWLAWPSGAVSTWVGIGAGYLCAAVVMRLMPRWWRTQCDEEMQTRVSREYRRAVIPAMVLYSLCLFASIWLLKRGIDSLPLRALVALLPVLPIAWVMHAFLRYLRRIDELQRRIELEAIGVAALVVSMTYLTAGFLQQAKVIAIPSDVAMIWVFPLMCLGYAGGKFFAVRRFR